MYFKLFIFISAFSLINVPVKNRANAADPMSTPATIACKNLKDLESLNECMNGQFDEVKIYSDALKHLDGSSLSLAAD